MTNKSRSNVREQSLAVLEKLAANKEGVMRHLPIEYNSRLSKGLAYGVVERAWCHISSHDIAGILFQVQSRLLDFVLALKDTVGETTTVSELREKSISLDARSLFNNAIFGSGSNHRLLFDVWHKSS